MKFSSTVLLLLSVIKGGQSEENIVTAMNAFGAALYQVISEESSSNLIMSPFSVESALAMVLVGLRGTTAESVSAALYVPNDRPVIELVFKLLFDYLKMAQNSTLEIANKIYVQQGNIIKDEYQQSLEENFRASAEVVDFSTNTEAVRQAINDWAEMATKGLIQDIIPEGSLDPDTVLMLLNAIYFKGLWQIEFDKRRTSTREFLLDTKSTKNVQMMHMNATSFPHGDLPEFDARVLKLPYQGETPVSMLIILPTEIDGLNNLESKFASFNLTNVLENLEDTYLKVNIPCFEIESSLDLKVPLGKLGFSEILEDGGDFSGMTDAAVTVSSVLHKAYIEVTEEGTEAAAVTGIGVSTSSNIVVPEFTADHPFMFLIVEDVTETILFIGRFLEPQ